MVLVNDNVDTRAVMDACVTRRKMCLNPIIEWSDEEVWDFIKSEGIPYCCLYDEGFHRLGCVGCPMAGRHGREREFLRWPKYELAYLSAFGRMLEERKRKGKIDSEWNLATPRDVFRWWMQYDVLPGQMDMFEDEYDPRFIYDYFEGDFDG